MNARSHNGNPAAIPAELAARAGAALRQLAAARCFAAGLKAEPWQFAIEAGHLLAAGLTAGELRWLVCEGLAEHAVETTALLSRQRTFRRAGNLALKPQSCFLLTPAGLAAVEGGPWAVAAEGSSGTETEAAGAPCWDADAHTLSWAGQVVKRFRSEAPQQEGLLEAFERAGWPRCLAAKRVRGDCPKARLRQTVKNLNRSVRPHLHFALEGNGGRVSWEAATALPQRDPNATP